MQIRTGWIPNCSTMAVWLDPVAVDLQEMLVGLLEYFLNRSGQKNCKVEIYNRYKSTSVELFKLFDFEDIEEFSTERVDVDELLKKHKQHQFAPKKEHYISTELVIETEYGSIQFDGRRFEVQIKKLGTSPKEDWLTELYPYLRQFEKVSFSDGYSEDLKRECEVVVTFFGNE